MPPDLFKMQVIEKDDGISINPVVFVFVNACCIAMHWSIKSNGKNQ